MSAADILGQSNKKHSNRSKNGKKGKKGPEAAGKRKNTKAFNVSNVVSAKKNIQRNLDKAQQKEVVPLVNREEAVPPPSLVVVMGPKSCGKTTLIRSLVKIYTGQNMTDTTGPVTVIAGNKKRFTFFECPLDLYSMTDLAKVPDLVLLMIDASYGLEMETFEYLNLLQLHGFPKVIGVLTHLDRFRSVKSLQNTKKEIKHRFWTEIYKGAKLFDFMGVVNGKYRKHEVKRLSLQINRVKFRPLVWHNTHPYLLVDRVEDVTPVTAGGAKRSGQSNETEEEDFQGKDESGEKEVTLYGYVRGCHLKSTTKIHLVGAGDFDMHSITALPDPCPLKSSDASQTALKQSRKKDHLLYAPMANVGRVSMDKDSLYIDLKHIHYTKKDQIYLPDQQQQAGVGEEDLGKGTPMDLLRSMQEVKMGVDQQLKRSKGELSLFSNSSSFPMEESDGENEEEEDEYDRDDSEEEDEGEDEDEEEDEDDEEDEEEYGDGESENDTVDEEDISENDETSDRDEKEGDDEDLEETDDPRTNHKTASETSKRLNSSLMMKQLLSSSSNRFNDVMKVVYGHSWAQSTTNKKENIFSDSLEKDEQDDDEDFFTLRSKTSRKDSSLISMNRIDSSRFCVRPSATNAADDSGASSSGLLGNWNSLSLSISEICQRNSRNYAKLKTRFVTGGYSKPLVARSSDDGNDGAGDEEDDEVYGDFEDLEALDKERGENNEKDDVSNKSDDDDSEEDEVDLEEEQERMNEEIDQQLRALNAQKKSMFKMKFDREYDHKKSGDGSENEGDADGDVDSQSEGEGSESKGKRRKAEKTSRKDEEEDDVNLIEKAQREFELQAQRNMKEFGDEGELARHRYEGFRQGLYVRIHLKGVPQEFLENFSSNRPVIVGGLLPSETAMGFITARVKRHRWHKKILKSNDPLIFSIGWRRFQSIPVYTTTDQNERERYLKYTPQHMHCTSTFYGPLIAPNTGILAYQILDSQYAGFRVALTGTALEQRATPQVVKKLKLTGTPVKVYKNTAFITGMFNSALEVAKFEHAKIKTVSGIRGSIKKAVNAKNDMKGSADQGHHQLGRLPPGTFRATFEDKVLMSDIVICRVWVNVEPKKFYNPILSMLSETKEKNEDTTSTAPSNLMRSTAQLRKDMQIAQVVKKDSVYKPIVRQQREFSKLHIPTKLQEALPFASKPKLAKAKNPESYLARRAVILEPEERKQRGMIQMLSTIKKHKEAKRKVANKLRFEQKQKQIAKEKEKFEEIHKEAKKRKYKEDGLEKQRKMQKVQ